MNKYREYYTKLLITQQNLCKDFESKSKAKEKLILNKFNNEKAKYILNEVAKITQENFRAYIEEMVSLALKIVFDRDFKFIMEIEIKRGRSECKLMVKEGDGEPFIPKEEMGGGLVDLISIVLRMVMWSLEQPRSDNVFILDEPLKFLGHGELLDKALSVIRNIAKRMNIQLIMVSHEPELIKLADRAWLVSHKAGKSLVVPYNNDEEQGPAAHYKVNNDEEQVSKNNKPVKLLKRKK